MVETDSGARYVGSNCTFYFHCYELAGEISRGHFVARQRAALTGALERKRGGGGCECTKGSVSKYKSP